ncbi:Nif3-like dinuclear metal center hexameric protein [Mycoplasma crocodyli]|uniref:GTP cyclohydrolase 1 type 2 homolog n=1 Tax=Mycoplasma crocodyli (strain ATCC 51981 / MP145) TaxID=512564 RepID=D5E586_MYCCM|nr:Nif3-like dinuclear metal center hexameric protein [Mycoplasma crocodyli]ADE19494.1 hypothetical protein MCRO_0277 [Mycoplasma crocodyli MP145]
MTIKTVVDFLFSKYPLSTKEPWDPSGFSVKFNQSKKLTGVILAIDLTQKVLEEAIKNNCNLIITHHPFKFEKTWDDEDLKAPYKRDIFNKLKHYKISVIAFHTNYDYALEGTSFQIAKQLNLQNYVVFQENGYDCKIKYNTSVNNMINLIKDKLNLEAFRTNIPTAQLDTKISKIAILSGAGYISEVNLFSKKGYELIITSDIKWSDWIVYDQIKAPILDIPHLDEEVFCYDIFQQLKSKFNLENLIIVKHKTPYKNI